MDALEFVSSLVRSIAWPAATVAIAFMLRPILGRVLAGDLKRVKLGPTGFEAEWQERAEVVRQEAARTQEQEIRVTEQLERQPVYSDLAEERTLAGTSPRSAMLRCYARIEDELRAAVATVAPQTPPRSGVYGWAVLARQHGMVTDATVNAVQGLEIMRTLAERDEGRLTVERAQEYVDLTEAVLYAIRNDQRRAPHP